MKRAKVELRLDQEGHGSLLVDGADISSEVSGLYLAARPGRVPELTVEMAGLEAGAIGGVQVSESVAAALVALGWAPPRSETDKKG